MKSTAATFLLGALVGAAIALGVRAAILNLDDGEHSAHGDHAVAETPSEHEGHSTPKQPSKDPADMQMPETPKGFLIDLGNEKCPIMGNDVNGRTWSEWNGLRVGHCCPPCIKDLLADPEKGLDDAGIEWREAAKLVADVEAASGEERKRLLALADEKYGIVRMPEGEE